jgi:hypothetical protein
VPDYESSQDATASADAFGHGEAAPVGVDGTGASDLARANLIAAGVVLRNWATARRATWTDQPLRAARPPAIRLAPIPAPAHAVEPPVEVRPPAEAPKAAEHLREGGTASMTVRPRVFPWRRVIVTAAALALAAGSWMVRGDLLLWFTTAKERVAEMTSAQLQRSRAALPAPAAEAPPVAAPTTGRLELRSTPEGARVLVNGEERGVTPLTIEDVAPGAHTVVFESVNGSLQRRVQVTAGATATIDEAIYSGWLHVSSPIELEISEGSNAYRLNEQNLTMLTPGSHNLRFENRHLGYSETRRVVITPGETTAIAVVPEKSRLSVASSLPAEVYVDGERVGETPLIDHPVDLGTRDVILRSLTGIERRMTVTVGAQPARLDVDFSQP